MTENVNMLQNTSSNPEKIETELSRKFQGKESFLSSQISLYVKDTKPKIPDGGWGWCVVFAAFTLNLISEGVTLSFGFLYIEFLEEFKASASATSWIGSLFMAIPLLAGPVASALVDKYGCKWMTIVGGLTCMLGFILSAFANSIGVMYFTFGIIGGLSRGLTYVTAVVAIAFWFEKKRTVALGLQASGAGIGTVAFAPLTIFLLNNYGWRGTLVVLAGIFANMCACGMIMKDPEWITEEEEREKELKKLSKKRSPKKTAAGLNHGEEIQTLLTTSYPLDKTPTKNKFLSMVNLPTFQKHNEKVPTEGPKQPNEHEHRYNDNLAKSHRTPISKSTFEKPSHSNKHTIFPKISEEDELRETGKLDENVIHVEDSGVDDKTQTGNNTHSYLNSMRHRRNSMGCRGALVNMHKYRSTAMSCPDVYRNSLMMDEKSEGKWYTEVLDILKSMANFSLFLELHFLLQSLSTIILFTWFIVPYFYLAEHMTRLGYTEDQASLAISVIGFTNTIGMVFLGIVGDRFNVAKTYSVCLILCGISILSMMYFTNSYILLLINSALFGLFFASCFSLSPALLSTLVPLDDFTMAYGLGLLCEGIGNLIGPPLAGFLFDITQSWEQSFYQAGFWIILSGILVGIIAFTKNRRIVGSAPLMNDQKNKNTST